MADQPAIKSLPFGEAIDSLKAKGFHLPETFDWRDMWQGAHATAFTVAKSAGFDILKDIHGAVLKAQTEGRTFKEFQAELTPILQAKGWWGKKEVADPLTGETVLAQLGSPRRLQIIYDTNMRTAYAAGRWAQIERVKARRPFLRYVSILDGRTRPEHRAWHGTILPVDHAWWQTHFPPNGWRCRCTVQQLSQADMDEFGYKVSPDPNDEQIPWTNDRTGEVVMTPRGVDPGFGYNPGKAAVDENAARALMGKLVDAPADLAAAQAASARFAVPALERETTTWIKSVFDQVEANRPPNTGVRRVVGALDAEVLAFLEGKGRPPQSGAITIDDIELAHIFRHRDKPIGIPPSTLTNMVQAVWEPQAIYFEKATSILHYVLDGEDKAARLIVQVDYSSPEREKRGIAGFMTNRIKSGRMLAQSVYDNGGLFERIR